MAAGDQVVKYYNRQGNPWSNEDESYWLNPVENVWYRGTRGGQIAKFGPAAPWDTTANAKGSQMPDYMRAEQDAMVQSAFARQKSPELQAQYWEPALRSMSNAAASDPTYAKRITDPKSDVYNEAATFLFKNPGKTMADYYKGPGAWLIPGSQLATAPAGSAAAPPPSPAPAISTSLSPGGRTAPVITPDRTGAGRMISTSSGTMTRTPPLAPPPWERSAAPAAAAAYQAGGLADEGPAKKFSVRDLIAGSAMAAGEGEDTGETPPPPPPVEPPPTTPPPEELPAMAGARGERNPELSAGRGGPADIRERGSSPGQGLSQVISATAREPMPSANRPEDSNEPVRAYYNASGQPYSNEDESYWYSLNDRAWYKGTKDGKVTKYGLAPPWEAAKGGSVTSATPGKVTIADLLASMGIGTGGKTGEGAGGVDVQPGVLTLATLLGQQRPKSWLTPGVGYGSENGRTQYWNAAGRPFKTGEDRESYWYSKPEQKWYRGELSGSVSEAQVQPWNQLPWLEQPWQTPSGEGSNVQYFNAQGRPFGPGDETSYWYNRADQQWYQGDTKGNVKPAYRLPWM